MWRWISGESSASEDQLAAARGRAEHVEHLGVGERHAQEGGADAAGVAAIVFVGRDEHRGDVERPRPSGAPRRSATHDVVASSAPTRAATTSASGGSARQAARHELGVVERVHVVAGGASGRRTSSASTLLGGEDDRRSRASLRRAPQVALDGAHELARVERLGHVLVDAGVEAAHAIDLLALEVTITIGTSRWRGCARSARRQLVAVELGHHDVGRDQVEAERVALGDLQAPRRRRAPVTDCRSPWPRAARNSLAHDVAVLDEQDAAAAVAGRTAAATATSRARARPAAQRAA